MEELMFFGMCVDARLALSPLFHSLHADSSQDIW
jgi:hypothetical protein